MAQHAQIGKCNTHKEKIAWSSQEEQYYVEEETISESLGPHA